MPRDDLTLPVTASGLNVAFRLQQEPQAGGDAVERVVRAQHVFSLRLRQFVIIRSRY